MHYSRALVAASGFFALGVSGCAPDGTMPNAWDGSAATSQASNTAVHPVAVIDLDAIAQQLGRDREMVAAIQKHEASLNQQLEVVQASYQKDIDQKQQVFGQSPTAEQQRTLLDMRQQASGKFSEVRRRVQSEMDLHRLQVIQHFREEVRPIARDVARRRNLSIVVTKNDSFIFDYAPSVDITDDVLERMRALQQQAQ